MMQLYIFIGIVFFLVLACARFLWIKWKVEEYAIMAAYYDWKSSIDKQVAIEMMELWPREYLYLEVWRWNFTRYIVHQDHYIEMIKIIIKDLQSNNIDWAEFQSFLDKRIKQISES